MIQAGCKDTFVEKMIATEIRKQKTTLKVSAGWHTREKMVQLGWNKKHGLFQPLFSVCVSVAKPRNRFSCFNKQFLGYEGFKTQARTYINKVIAYCNVRPDLLSTPGCVIKYFAFCEGFGESKTNVFEASEFNL